MKILMVNKFLYPRGGSESYMLKLGAELASKGHEVEYFGMYDEKNTVGNTAGEYTQNMDFHSEGFSRFLYPFKIIYSFEAKRKISKVLDTFKPDVVHMNNINFQLTPSIVYAVKKRGIPLVQTVHDYQMICPNHLLYSFTENTPCERCIKASKLNCLRHSCIHSSKIKSLIGVIESWLYRLLGTYKKVDVYICPGRFLEKKLHEAEDFYKKKTEAIHNFIEKKNVFPRSDSTKSYVAFVGRLSKEKGVELLSECARLLPELSFVVAGSGPDEEILKNINNIDLKGFLTGDELTNIIVNADALIAPSVCYENCPLSILEAHSMGVPVVTMNYGGMAELVEDEVTGSLCPVPKGKDLAETVMKTLSDKEKLKKLSENCLKKSEEILSVEGYAEKIIDIYRSIPRR